MAPPLRHPNRDQRHDPLLLLAQTMCSNTLTLPIPQRVLAVLERRAAVVLLRIWLRELESEERVGKRI